MAKPKSPSAPRTIHEVVAELHAEEARQQADALDDIKAIRAAGGQPMPEQSALAVRKHARVTRVPSTVVKVDEEGNILGYYREGQVRGRPNGRMPLEVDLEQVTEAYLKSLVDAVPVAQTNAILAQRGVATRRADSKAKRIRAEYQTLVEQGVARQSRVARVVARVGCNEAYARRVLRAAGVRLGPPKK